VPLLCRPLLYTGQDATPNLATVERIIPGSQGGTYRLENTLVVCYSCNQKRGNKRFQNFVSGSRFPRREWLMKKYEEALKIMTLTLFDLESDGLYDEVTKVYCLSYTHDGKVIENDY
jgi:hypothetical protein